MAIIYGLRLSQIVVDRRPVALQRVHDLRRMFSVQFGVKSWSALPFLIRRLFLRYQIKWRNFFTDSVFMLVR